MASKITPQLQAVGKGFSNIDPGYSKLTRMREDSDRKVAQLTEQERDRRERDLQAEADVERVMATQKANMDQVNSFGDKIYTKQKEALAVNKETFKDNFTAQEKQHEAKIKARENFLSEVVPSFTGMMEGRRKKKWDRDQKNSTTFWLQYGISLEDQQKIDLLEDHQWAKGEELEQVADELRLNGFTLEEEMYVRHQNSASDYGRAKAYSITAGNKFFDWAKQQLPKMEADTVEQKQAAMVILQHRYLEAHNLTNVSADFLEPMFQQMRAATDKIINGATRARSIEMSKERSLQHLQVLSTAYSTEAGGQALNNFFLQKTREVDVNGQSLSPTDAKLAVFKAAYNIDHFPSDEKVYKLFMETKMLHMNKTWGEGNPDLLRDLMHQRGIQRENRKSVSKAVLDARKAEERKTFKEFLDDPERYNGDAKVVQQGIDQLFKSGHTVEELAPFMVYLDQSVQGRADGDYWRGHINDLAEKNVLSTEDLTGPYVPRDLKLKYWSKAVQNDELYSTIDLKAINKDLSGALREALKEDSLTTALHSSHAKALHSAELEFRKEFLRNGGDADKALQNIELKIKNGTGNYKVIEPSQQEIANGVTSFFASFTPGNHDNAPPILNVSTFKERQKIKQRVAKDPSLLYRDLLVKPQKLKDIADAIREGRNYRLPEVFFDISNWNPDKMGSPTDIWQQQLKAAQDLGYLDKMNLKMEDFKGTMFRDSTDPLGKQIIQTLRTKADFRKALQYTYKPDSVRDPKYMSPLVGGTVTNTLPRVYTEPIPVILDNDTQQFLKDSPDFEYRIQEGTNVGGFYRVEV